MKNKTNYYKDSIRYLKETKNYIIIIVAIFLISAVIGLSFPYNFRILDNLLKNIINETQGLNTFQLILFILQNNLQAAFYGLLLGIFFGIMPIMNALLNGVVLGYVFSIAKDEGGLLTIWRILPHGIFELPAIFISLGLGLKLGMVIFSKNKSKELKRRLFSSILVFFTIVLPLLIIAAIIEGLLIYFIK